MRFYHTVSSNIKTTDLIIIDNIVFNQTNIIRAIMKNYQTKISKKWI